MGEIVKERGKEREGERTKKSGTHHWHLDESRSVSIATATAMYRVHTRKATALYRLHTRKATALTLIATAHCRSKQCPATATYTVHTHTLMAMATYTVHTHILIATAMSGTHLRPTQSVMYVPLQANRFAESVLLIVQYRYLKSCSGDFILQNLILCTRSCVIGFITQSGWVVHFHLTESVRWK